MSDFAIKVKPPEIYGKDGENMLIHAEGNPAQVVAVGVAAAAVVVLAVRIGYGAYCGGEKLVGGGCWIKLREGGMPASWGKNLVEAGD
jgi:hypothetical protein